MMLLIYVACPAVHVCNTSMEQLGITLQHAVLHARKMILCIVIQRVEIATVLPFKLLKVNEPVKLCTEEILH